jgi:hypothetical protein
MLEVVTGSVAMDEILSLSDFFITKNGEKTN